jgi:hypothetical protein
MFCGSEVAAAVIPQPKFITRGVILRPEDLSLGDWPERARRAGLTTIGMHPWPGPLMNWIRKDAGMQFLEKCRTLGLEVEYELHAMGSLLPRKLFDKNPEMFRMNATGQRTPVGNCCLSNERAMEIIAQSAQQVAQVLRPTTGRYFLWGDDMQSWCQCPSCRGLSPSDQALKVANTLCGSIRRQDSHAQVAHLAYQWTLPPPTQIKPVEGIFLEYAPERRHDVPFETQKAEPRPAVVARAQGASMLIDTLDANLKLFPRDTAQVLEYWIDVSRFMGQQHSKERVRLPWNRDVFLADLASYRRRGIRHITSFACRVDAEYLKKFGDPSFIAEYGEGLSQ